MTCYDRRPRGWIYEQPVIPRWIQVSGGVLEVIFHRRTGAWPLFIARYLEDTFDLS